MALKLYTNSFSRGVVVDWLLIELGFLKGTPGPNRFGPAVLGQP